MTLDTDTRSLLNHLHRGGRVGYWWTLENHRSDWWEVGKPTPLPGGRRNVYFGVHPTTTIPPTNAKGETKPSTDVRAQLGCIAAINCLFAEYDAKDFAGDKDAAYAKIESLDPPPSAVVDSGGGYHLYWLLDSPFVLSSVGDSGRARKLQAAWVTLVDGDPQSKDLARVLRVPGTHNYKYTPARPVTILSANFDRLYAIGELAALAQPFIESDPAPDARTNGAGDLSAWLTKALAGEIAKVASSFDGKKHDRIRDSAIALGGLAHLGLSEQAIEDGLYAAIEARAVDKRGARKTIQDGISYGKLRPRKGPELRPTDDEAPEIEPIVTGSSFPDLPEAAFIDAAIGADACPWLDEYIAFSRRWSPQSYDGFHEACGLWVLAAVAARRVMLPFGGDKFTPLYIALCARTSLWAKSTAAKIAKETITAVGLGQLLAPDISTPQAFLRRLAERVPADYGKETPEAQALHRAALAFAGQRGWWHEEFGTHLAGMMRDGGAMADFRGHLRILDDCPPSYAYDTVGHGLTIIKRPYLALLANLTPTDLAPFARKGGALWGDGYFARFAFVTPPVGAERSRERFPDGWRAVPPSLCKPLRMWHEQLGIPDVEITERLDDKDKPTGEFQLIVTPIEPQRCTLGAGVVDAFYRYRETLIDLVDSGDNHDLDGSYTRFAEKALRVALLLASFSNGGRIELSHWARAQQITERWRASLHHLIDQLGQSEDTPDRILEDKINRLFARHPVLTAREAGRFLHVSTGEAERMLDQLAKGGAVLIEQGKRTRRYRATAASVASVTVSHVSHPAKVVTLPQDPPAPFIGSVTTFSSSDICDIVTVATVPLADSPFVHVDRNGEYPELDPIPRSKHSTTLMMLASSSEKNQRLARERCEEYGLDFESLRAWAKEQARLEKEKRHDA